MTGICMEKSPWDDLSALEGSLCRGLYKPTPKQHGLIYTSGPMILPYRQCRRKGNRYADRNVLVCHFI